MGTTVHVEVDGLYAGHLVISDEVKPDAAEAIRKLKELGVQKTVMLTGDAQPVASAWARSWGWTRYTRSFCPRARWSAWRRS